MNEFLSLEALTGFAAGSAAVALATDVLKRYISADPKWIALGAALLIQLALRVFWFRDLSGQGITVMLLNTICLLAGSVGAYEIVKKRPPVSANPDGAETGE